MADPKTPDTRTRREARDMSIRELERRTGINRGRLSIIERGVIPTDDEAKRIAAVLDVDDQQAP